MNTVKSTQFLQDIFGDLPDGEIICVGEQLVNGGFLQVEGNGKAHKSWEAAGRPRALYYNVSTVCPPKAGEMVRRRKTDSIAAYVFTLDDIGTSPSSKVAEDKITLEPSYKIETSPNNYQYGYILDKPMGDLPRYEAIVEVLGKKGLSDEGMVGCTRFCRMPGSLNLKPKHNNWCAKLTHYSPELRYSVDEFMAGMGINEQDLAYKAFVNEVQQANLVADGLPVQDELLEWLNKTGRVKRDTGGEWVDIECLWHKEHTDQDTGGTAYSPLGRGAGGWAHTRNWKCQHGHCINRDFGAFVEKLVELGGPLVSGFDPLTVAQARYCYVGEDNRIVDLYQRDKGGHWQWELESWSNMNRIWVNYPGHQRPILLKTALLEDPKTKKVARSAYLPGQPALTTEHGQECVNTYIEPRHPPTSETPNIFLDHIDYLLPNYREKVWFLDWLAYKIQNPAKRSCAVVMVADAVFGIGRSWLGHFIKKVLQGHVNKATLDQLIGRGTLADQNYNDWAARCLFLICDEAKVADPQSLYSAYETLKQRVDTSPVIYRSNTKYGKTSMETMFWNALIFSNHADCLIVPEDDRRIAVLTNPAERQTPQYYDRLHTALDDEKEARRAFWYLKNRDVSGFNPAMPILTEAKASMIRASKSPSDEVFEWLLDNVEGDLITRKNLQTQVKKGARALGLDQIENSPGGTVRRVWRQIGSLNPQSKHGVRVQIDTIRDEVRALRNKSEWRALDASTDRDKFVAELTKNTGDIVSFAGVA